MYGGRAIDSFDRRVLSTYMDEYMGDFIFDTFQPFYFHRTDDAAYYIPTANVEQNLATGLPVKEMALGNHQSIRIDSNESFFFLR
jgi:dynein heavy chain, axonemal